LWCLGASYRCNEREGLLQVLAKCPDVDRAVGRMFLGRCCPSEFISTMRYLAALPTKLLGRQGGVESAHSLNEMLPDAAILLQTFLQSACDADVR
jgi:DNA mismatch repair ATPase MutS